MTPDKVIKAARGLEALKRLQANRLKLQKNAKVILKLEVDSVLPGVFDDPTPLEINAQAVGYEDLRTKLTEVLSAHIERMEGELRGLGVDIPPPQT